MQNSQPTCKRCGNDDPAAFEWRGVTHHKHERRFRCKKCGKFGRTGDEKMGKHPDNPDNALYAFMDNGETAEVTAILDLDTINSPEKLISALSIDTDTWEIYKKLIGKAPAWRKDRSVQWKVKNGEVVEGDIRDSGKIKVVPVFTVKVWLRRKTKEIRKELALEDFKKEVHKFTPKIIPIKYPKPLKGMLFEMEMPDIHIGKLTWGEESGEDSDLKLQIACAKNIAIQLLSHTKHYPVERILFPIGNDYYNVDNAMNTTTHGTPQQEDTRWRKTFRRGWQLAAELINMAAQVAPVDVLIVGGNHDEERSFYLGEVLSAMYATNKRVTVDNSARLRKYYSYGKVLLGLTHGYHEKLRELKDIMLYEAKELLAEAKYIEWHTGDKHHKEDYVHKTHESNNGVVVRILRSLTPPDAWHYNKGFVGALKASEAFLWDKEKGLIAQFTAIP